MTNSELPPSLVTDRISFRLQGEKLLKPAPGTVVEVGVRGAGERFD